MYGGMRRWKWVGRPDGRLHRTVFEVDRWGIPDGGRRMSFDEKRPLSEPSACSRPPGGQLHSLTGLEGKGLTLEIGM